MNHEALTQGPEFQPSLSHVPAYFSEPLGTDEVRMQTQGRQTSQEAKLVSKLGLLLFWEHHGANIIKAVTGFNHFLKGL